MYSLSRYQHMTFFFILLSTLFCLAAHPIEKISVGELTIDKGEFLLQVRLFEEDLQPILRRNGLDPEVSFRDYMSTPFDGKILPSIEGYVKSNLELKVNDKALLPNLKKVEWVEKDKFSDHAAIVIEVNFSLGRITKGQVLKMRNTLLHSVYGQTNLIHIRLSDYENTWIFNKGNETNEVKWP